MNPNATLKALVEALQVEDYEGAYDLAADLRGWAVNGDDLPTKILRSCILR